MNDEVYFRAINHDPIFFSFKVFFLFDLFFLKRVYLYTCPPIAKLDLLDSFFFFVCENSSVRVKKVGRIMSNDNIRSGLKGA